MKRVALAALFLLFVSSVAYAAIDTAAKRSSACGSAELIPDGAIGAGDRSTVAGEYRGIIDGGGGGGAAVSDLESAAHLFCEFFKRRRR